MPVYEYYCATCKRDVTLRLSISEHEQSFPSFLKHPGSPDCIHARGGSGDILNWKSVPAEPLIDFPQLKAADIRLGLGRVLKRTLIDGEPAGAVIRCGPRESGSIQGPRRTTS